MNDCSVRPDDWVNPLRDKRDKRMPRIAGPCAVVIFGVTGDLARKKLMPAIYDLANRGLLPPTFALVGFARRDWADEDFGKVVLDAVKQHARTPFRQEVWDRLAEGIRFVQGTFDDEKAFKTLADTLRTAGRRTRYRRQPRLLPVDPAEGLSPGARAAVRVGAGHETRRLLEPGGHREAVRPRPFQRRSSQPSGEQRVPRVVGVPHRPLPGQGNGAEHPGASLRQPDVRADLERPLRRPRPDHHGRGHRTRWSRRILRRCRRRPRRHPEPPHPAAGAHRDGGARQLSSRRVAVRKDQGAVGHPTRRATRRDHAPAVSTDRAGRAARRSSGCSTRRASRRPPPPRRSRRSPWTSTPAGGLGCRSTFAPESGWAAG